MQNNKIVPLTELPINTPELVAAGLVTYRGLGMGKEGTKIKINGKEYVISDADFNTLGGITKMRFVAPFRK